jgi:lambda repressor-like predicted transcriptional regulator
MDEKLKKILKDIPPQKLDELLKVASKKLGMDPEKIKSELNNDTTSAELMKKAKGVSSSQLKAVLNDPKTLEGILSSPKGRKLIEELLGGGKKDNG